MKTPCQPYHHLLRTSNLWFMSIRGVPAQTHWPTLPPRCQKHSLPQRCCTNSSSSLTFPGLPAYTYPKTANLYFWHQPMTAFRAQPPRIWSCPAHVQCTWTCDTVLTPDLLTRWVVCHPASSHHTPTVTCTRRTAYHKLPTHHAK